MEQFLRACKLLGVDVVPARPAKVRQAIAKQLAETFMFFICGYDFIYAPSDKKFRGIVSVFIEASGPLHINISDEKVAEFINAVYDPDINVSVEGTSFYQKRVLRKGVVEHVQTGQKVTYDKVRMGQYGQAAGMRAGGVGNYNLQTRALESCMKNNAGWLNAYNKFWATPTEFKKDAKGQTLSQPSTQIQFVQAFRNPMQLTAMGRELNDMAVNDIRQALLPYWDKEGVAVLGVA
jgi:hypothetical protein